MIPGRELLDLGHHTLGPQIQETSLLSPSGDDYWTTGLLATVGLQRDILPGANGLKVGPSEKLLVPAKTPMESHKIPPSGGA